jgi:hypothetical protein
MSVGLAGCNTNGRTGGRQQQTNGPGTTASDRPTEGTESTRTGTPNVAVLDELYRSRSPGQLPVPEDRPAVALTDDGWFEYVDGGTTWQSVGSDRSQRPTTARSITICRDTDETVRAQGPDGEISSGQNAGAVIQDAVDAASTDTYPGTTISVEGAFTIGSPIQLADHVSLDLRGARLSTGGQNQLLQAIETTGGAVIGGVLDGDSQSESDDMRLFDGVRATDIRIENVRAVNGGHYGINLFECDHCTVQGCATNDNARHGIHLGTDTRDRGYHNRVRYCRAVGNGVDGINDRGSTVENTELYTSLVGCHTAANGRMGIVVSSGVDTPTPSAVQTVTNCSALGNGEDGFLVAKTRASLTEPIAADNDGAGIRIRSANNVSVLGPRVSNNQRERWGCGIKVESVDDIAPGNISVVGGQARNNWRNIYVSTNTPISNVAFRDIDASDGADANVYLYSEQSMSDIDIENVTGYRTENRGRYDASGDGSSDTFRWPHDLAVTPSFVDVTPATPAARGSFSVSAQSERLVIRYDEPPEEGEQNLAWWWQARDA